MNTVADVTVDSGDRWYCEGGCEESYPFSVPRDYRAIASDHLLTLRVPFCPGCCAIADSGPKPLPPPPQSEIIRLPYDNRHRYWNRWLERWILPPVGVPGQAARVDPAPTDGAIHPTSRGPLPAGTATEASILGEGPAVAHAVAWEPNPEPNSAYPLFAEGRWVCICGAHWPGGPVLVPPTTGDVLPAWTNQAAMWGPGVLDHLRGAS